MGFSRQEYWSGLPFSSPGYLPNPEIEPWSPALQADALPFEPPHCLLLSNLQVHVLLHLTDEGKCKIKMFRYTKSHGFIFIKELLEKLLYKN